VDVDHGRRAAVVDGSEDVLVLRDDQADAAMEDVPRVHVRSGEGSQDRTLAVDHVHEFRLGMSFGVIVVVVHRCEQSSHAYVVVVVEVGQTPCGGQNNNQPEKVGGDHERRCGRRGDDMTTTTTINYTGD